MFWNIKSQIQLLYFASGATSYVMGPPVWLTDKWKTDILLSLAPVMFTVWLTTWVTRIESKLRAQLIFNLYAHKCRLIFQKRKIRHQADLRSTGFEIPFQPTYPTSFALHVVRLPAMQPKSAQMWLVNNTVTTNGNQKASDTKSHLMPTGHNISNNLPPSLLFDQVLDFEDICSLYLYLCIELTNRNSYCVTQFLLIKSECGFYKAQVAQLWCQKSEKTVKGLI